MVVSLENQKVQEGKGAIPGAANGYVADRAHQSVAELESADGAVDEAVIVLIEPRVLIRECLSRCLQLRRAGSNVIAIATLPEWQKIASRYPIPTIIILSTGEQNCTKAQVEKDVSLLRQGAEQPPVIILCDEEGPHQILEALDGGAKGFIPTSVSFDVALEAIRLVRAGGVFIPASSLMAARNSIELSRSGMKSRGNGMFTERQAEVVEAVRQGKANKIIAYELNMRESTVKVHIRNIMRKLNAKNRTEVAYLTHSLSPSALGH